MTSIYPLVRWAPGRRRPLAACLPLLSLLVAGACGGSLEGVEAVPIVLGGDAVPDVQYDVERGDVVLAMAPVDLPANAGHSVVRQAPALTAAVPVDGWLGGYIVEVVDRDGRPVPREVIHHVNIMAPDRRELFSEIMQRMGAVGAETAPVRMPRLLGYPISKGEHIIVIGELHNPTAQDYNGVRVLVRMPHIPSTARPRPVDIQPFYIDVTPPAELHSFDLPPGRSETSWEGQAPVDGRMVMMGGHLHDHAVELRLEDATENRVLWRTEPILDADNRVIGMPQANLIWRLGLKIRAGNTYRLVAVYDNPTGQTLVDGGMGALGGVFLPAQGAIWPRSNPEHPEYIRDIALRITDRDRAPGPAAADGHDAHSHH
jgi:hypothetical protein